MIGPGSDKNEQVCSRSKEDVLYTLQTIYYLDIFCGILYTDETFIVENLAILAQNIWGITMKHIC